MSYVTGLRCLRCETRYREEDGLYVCDCRPNQESDLGTLDVEYDYAAIATDWKKSKSADGCRETIDIWAPLLPVANVDSLPPLPVGGTPLLPALRLGAPIGVDRLYIKDDGRNPTGSLKDRASAMAVARAKEAGASMIATASTGNAAAALAGLSASAGMPCTIFVPESAPKAKLAQLLVYGANVLPVRGTYDKAFDLCTQACTEFGWYNRNTGFNPYMSEGKKTVSFEIARQLHAIDSGKAVPNDVVGRAGGFVAPDAVFVSTGDGCIIGGVYKGFYDMLQLGWIRRIPRIYGVQSVQSDALYRAWRAGEDVPQPVVSTTRADSIGVNSPRDAVKALRAVRLSGGEFLVVSDEEILDAILPLAHQAAVFAEPAGAAAYAGLKAAARRGMVRHDEVVVVINTGSGMKDIQAAMDVTGGVESIDATMDAVRARVVQ